MTGVSVLQKPLIAMPTQKAIEAARRKAREGRKPTTQAGEFVKEEMLRYEHGDLKSRQQAIAIGLSEARRAGVKLPAPKKNKSSTATRKKLHATRLSVNAGRNLPLQNHPAPAKARSYASEWLSLWPVHPRTEKVKTLEFPWRDSTLGLRERQARSGLIPSRFR